MLFGGMSAQAGEIAVLSSGFTMRVDRHETANGAVTLYSQGGKIEMPAAQVVRFDQEEYAPPAAPKAESPAPPPSKVKLSPQEIVARAAEKWGLPPALVHAVAKAESGYNPKAVSPKGAIGLMQLMPGTAAELKADPNDPEQNADAGARYLRELLLKYDSSAHRALAAYNAGPGAVDKYKGVPPYRETREYVDRVMSTFLASQVR
jgi:soluble lytic murein transglycosylase-like protein